ncbi:unnamed protein product [Amoebophrya sp. A25]|nr:unnamed protein product [Amoebophrya sp. A25]|eukprot:GSA25T00023152001.1
MPQGENVLEQEDASILEVSTLSTPEEPVEDLDPNSKAGKKAAKKAGKHERFLAKQARKAWNAQSGEPGVYFAEVREWLEKHTEDIELVMDVVCVSEISDTALEMFRDLRQRDNNYVTRDEETDKLVFAEGGSTIGQVLRCSGEDVVEHAEEQSSEKHEPSSSSSPGTASIPQQKPPTVTDILLKRSQFLQYADKIVAKAKDQGSPIRVVVGTPDVLKQILECKTLGPCTVLAVSKKPENVPFYNLQEERPRSTNPTTSASTTSTSTSTTMTSPTFAPRKLLILDGLTNSENVGSLIRTASCFGVEGVVLSKHCCTCWSRRAVRVSMGHCFRIPIYIETDEYPLEMILEKFKNINGDDEKKNNIFAAVVQRHTQYLHRVSREQISSTSLAADANSRCTSATSPGGNAISTSASNSNRTYALVMGAEQDGVTERVRALCDEQLMIKMCPGVDSFNVGVAASIIMHHFETVGLEDDEES